ncbi:MAG: hypothetical protein ACFFCO_04845 [Promethearchaeota archaeon]
MPIDIPSSPTWQTTSDLPVETTRIDTSHLKKRCVPAHLTGLILFGVHHERKHLGRWCIYSQLIKEGHPIDPEDSMIAAIAIVHGETLLTKNPKRFSRVPGLKIEEY